MPELEVITAQALSRLMESGSPLTLLDVREDEERAFCRIDMDDLHIPMRDVPGRLDELQGVVRPIVVYCHHGIRSMVVARWLAARGHGPVLNLDGGIDAWSESVDDSVARY